MGLVVVSVRVGRDECSVVELHRGTEAASLVFADRRAGIEHQPVLRRAEHERPEAD